ncbi:MAG TPA: zinc ribbon domain-containing protein [Trebonia sp.]|jgi:putative FmdB family regulatory protein
MPLYDFRCAECRAEQEVRASLAEADSLELVCVGCGGTMRRALSRATGVVIAVSPSPVPSSSSGPLGARTRDRRHDPFGGKTCEHGAVRLTRPNPFAQDLPRPDAEKSR